MTDYRDIFYSTKPPDRDAIERVFDCARAHHARGRIGAMGAIDASARIAQWCDRAPEQHARNSPGGVAFTRARV